MRRDMNLIREMMLELEQNSELNGRVSFDATASDLFPNIKRDDDTLTYHLLQIFDEGWVDGEYVEVSGDFIIKRITADGHDFIDAIRELGTWEKTVSLMRTAGGGTLRLALEVAKGVLRSEIQKRIGY
jgi:hypothetical protein